VFFELIVNCVKKIFFAQNRFFKFYSSERSDTGKFSNDKFVIFSKKLLRKVPNFLIHRLGSRRVYQKEQKKMRIVI
jgi:hypothetical protein